MNDPIAELRSRVDRHQERLDEQQTRLDAFVTEMRAHMTRIGEEGRDQRLALLDSNRKMGEAVAGFRTTLDVMVAESSRALDAFQNAQNAFDRNAQGGAARMKTLEAAVEELKAAKQEHITATRELRTTKRREGGERRKAKGRRN